MAKAPRSLAGRVVAITGGARGIGRATAAALIARGARVAIGDIDGPLAEKTAADLGAGTIGLPLDVTSRASFAAFLDEVEDRQGQLDVLVNNAGIMPIGPFAEETDATAKRLVDINLHGVILGSKLALEHFVPRRRGHLVNIASIAGKSGSPHIATYVATKHAVVGLTESIRMELDGTGIDVTVVMPVGVNTELYSGIQPLRGIKTPEPEDVAEAIVEALQTGRFEVYVPKRLNATMRITALLPQRARDAIGKAIGGDMMTRPDRAARAAYEARMAKTIAEAAAAQATEAAAVAEAAATEAEAAATEVAEAAATEASDAATSASADRPSSEPPEPPATSAREREAV